MEGIPDKIFVVTPMMTRGGEHSELEIPAAIEHFKDRFPDVHIEYVWPLKSVQVAQYLD